MNKFSPTITASKPTQNLVPHLFHDPEVEMSPGTVEKQRNDDTPEKPVGNSTAVPK